MASGDGEAAVVISFGCICLKSEKEQQNPRWGEDRQGHWGLVVNVEYLAFIWPFKSMVRDHVYRNYKKTRATIKIQAAINSLQNNQSCSNID